MSQGRSQSDQPPVSSDIDPEPATVGGDEENPTSEEGGETSPAASDQTEPTVVEYSPLREKLRPLLEDDTHVKLEVYWLERPYSAAGIFLNTVTGEHLYQVVEPDLNEAEHYLYEKLKDTLKDKLLYRENLEDEDDREEILETRIHEKVNDLPGVDPDDGVLKKVAYYLKRDLTGYERIQPFMNDPALEELSCNGTGIEKPIFVFHREYDNMETNIYYDEDQLRPFVEKLAQRSGKDISTANPTQGTSLPDGSRVQLTLEEISPDGESFTIRKFQEDPFTPIDLIEYETFSVEQLSYLWLLIENGYSGLIAGGTGAGKTTTLNALGLFAQPGKKIITIEDTREVKLPQKNAVSTLTREGLPTDQEGAGVDMFALLKSSLRMRPEYLVVGEVRGEEANNMFQAMNTGHTTYATIHADSMQSVLSRLKSEPMNIPKNLIAEIGFVAIQGTADVEGEKVRRNQGIYELNTLDVDTGDLLYEPTWEWNSTVDEMQQAGESNIIQQLKEKGHTPDEDFELRRRVLQYLVDNGINDYEAVSTVVRSFMRSPDIVLDQIEAGEIDLERLDELKDKGLQRSPSGQQPAEPPSQSDDTTPADAGESATPQ